jgi:gas vesicle protein
MWTVRIVWLIIGIFIGGTFGVIIAGLLCSSNRCEELNDRMVIRNIKENMDKEG